MFRLLNKESFTHKFPDNRTIKAGLLFFYLFGFLLRAFVGTSQPLLHFRNIEGLSQQMVYNLHVDSTGFLWIGTSDGLHRYDGKTMRVFRPEKDSHVPGLGGCIIRSNILEDSAGNLWLSTENGVYYFTPRTEKFTPVDFFNKGIPQRVASYPIAFVQGEIWFYNQWLGLFSYSPGSKNTRRFGSPSNAEKQIVHPVSYVFDTSGYIFSATRYGIFRFGLATGKWENIAIVKECRALTIRDDTLFASGENGVQFISMLNGRQGPVSFSEQGMVSIQCLYADGEGHVWAGDTRGGIWFRRKGMALFERAGYPGRFSGTPTGFSVYTLQGIGGRTLFAGGDVFGLKVADLDKPVFQNYPSPEFGNRTAQVFVTGIAGHSNGTVYAGTMDAGFLCKPKNAHAFRPFIPAKDINPASARTSALNDEKGNTWLNSGNFLLLLNTYGGIAQRIRLFAPPQASFSTIIVNCISAFEGYWIAGTNMGLYKIAAGKAHHVKAFNTNNAHCLWQQNDTTLWIGTEAGGMVVTHPLHLSHFGGQMLAGATIKYLMPDSLNGLLWISTTNGLVAMTLRNGAYRLYNEKDGLSNNFCYGTVMHLGALWLSTNRGISKIIPQLVKGEVFPRLHVASFTSDDGLPANEFNSRSFYGANNGVLYFGSIAGLTWFNPTGVNMDIKPPKTIITSCMVNGKPADSTIAAPWLQKLHLNWRQNEISFQMGVLEFGNSVPIEYSIQLSGYDSIPWLMSGQSVVRYTNMPPGRYTYMAKARSNGGQWGEATKIELIIDAPFWNRPWFYALSILVLIAIGAGISFLISGRKIKLREMELEKQKELEKERHRISREMHDDIGAGLTRIILMSDVVAKKHETMNELKDISHISRQLVASMREIIWSLNPENSNPDHLFAYLREIFYHQLAYTSIHYSINFPERTGIKVLSNEQLHNLLLVCKEAVNNAIIHSGCKNLTIAAGTTDGSLWFSIADDGRGFDKEAVNNGNGLKNMQGRITELKGSLSKETKEGCGTKLFFSIPVDE